MHFAPKYSIQTGGEMRHWSNPEHTFRFSLLKVNLDCEFDAYPGVVILTDPGYRNARVLELKDPRKELSKILAPLPDDTLVYWRIVRDDGERKKALAGLTAGPIFDDILG
jgi:hypothetical protein